MVCPGARVPALRCVVASPRLSWARNLAERGPLQPRVAISVLLPVVLSNPYLHWDSHGGAPGRTLGLGCTARVPTGP